MDILTGDDEESLDLKEAAEVHSGWFSITRGSGGRAKEEARRCYFEIAASEVADFGSGKFSCNLSGQMSLTKRRVISDMPLTTAALCGECLFVAWVVRVLSVAYSPIFFFRKANYCHSGTQALC